MMKFKKRKKRSNSRGYTLKGVVDHVNKKYAFIEIDEFSEDIKVRSRHLKGAIHGDKVEVRVSHQLSKRNLEGEVIKILERKTTDFIGTVEDSKGFAFFIPKNKKVFVDFFIRKKRSEKFSKKKKYLAKVVDWGNSTKKPEAKIIESIGNIGENDTEINSIIHDFDLPTEFPLDVKKETELLNEIISEKEIKKRKDLRSIDSFTIDPDDAKDFDDALSVEKENDTISIGIHIADVSHFFNVRTKIKKGSRKKSHFSLSG
ncbi:MAG: hypothetical protein Ct9H90mP3_2140 [Flammeovirgaceae bacterium]|nr:MAG: hypothetical protein Ct9H90mP3_2140 [Flammeovirgaceae bacterium]